MLITFPTIPTSSTLKVEPLTIEDTSNITNPWFAAFTDPQIRRVFPDTPSVRKWLEDANINDITNKLFQRYLKVVATESKDDQGRLRIAAYANGIIRCLTSAGSATRLGMKTCLDSCARNSLTERKRIGSVG
jgi:hypothetical protein